MPGANGLVSSMAEIRQHAEHLLAKAGVTNVFPTPVDAIVRAAELEHRWPNEEAFKEHLSSFADEEQAATFSSGWGKVLGYQSGALYGIHPTLLGQERIRVAFHEVAHRVLPWHPLPSMMTLSAAMRDTFEAEADAFADELIFKGHRFGALSAPMPLAFDSVAELARKHDASLHHTAVRFVTNRSGKILLMVKELFDWTVIASSPDYEPGDPEVDTIPIGSYKVEHRNGHRRYVLARALVWTGSRRLIA